MGQYFYGGLSGFTSEQYRRITSELTIRPFGRLAASCVHPQSILMQVLSNGEYKKVLNALERLVQP